MIKCISEIGDSLYKTVTIRELEMHPKILQDHETNLEETSDATRCSDACHPRICDNMARNLSANGHIDDMKGSQGDTCIEDEELTNVVMGIYGCADHPLSYMIEPKASIKIVDKNAPEITKEELESIL